MATIKYTHENEDNTKAYEFRKPVLFSRNEEGHLQADFQAPVAKKKHEKEVTIQSPFKKRENEEGKHEISIRSPIEKKDPEEEKTRVLFRP